MDVIEKQGMESDYAETMCMLEKEMTPYFFDIMFHLLLHLVHELFLCGPMHTRWMYPYEQYFKGLKGFVRNFANLEGSIAEGYQVEEALGFIFEYMAEYNITTRRVWDDKQELFMIDEISNGKGKLHQLLEELRTAFHKFVLDSSAHLEG